MASQTSKDGRLTAVYKNRIGTPSTDDEARGYWTFLVGLVLGFLGMGWLIVSDPTSSVTQGPIVVVGVGLILLIAGPIIRLPLQRWATVLVYGGAILSIVGVLWFMTAYPGWRGQAGEIIGVYSLGLLVMAIGGAFVPVLTRQQGAETAESILESELGEVRDTLSISETNEADLAEEVATLQNSLSDAEARNAELEREVTQLEDDIAKTASDNETLAALVTEHRTSQAQFELYEDQSEQWRWRLRHRSGDIIAGSNEGYDRKTDAQQSMQAVRRDALGATVLLIENEADLPEAGSEGGFVFPDVVESQATFELYEDEGEEYRWRLRHDNGNIIADGREGYASRDGAETAVEGIREYVGPAEYLQPEPTAIEVYKDEAAKWRWRLRHRNGNILAGSGEGYASRSGARRAIDRLRQGIGDMHVEVYEDEAGGFRWRVTGGDEKVKLDSGGYESRDGAAAAVERVREFLPDADLIDIGQAAFEVYEDESGDHRWRLRHRNGNILAGDGEGYAEQSGVWNGIESVKRNAPDADFEEVGN